MPAQITTRGQRHRDRRENYAEQCGQSEEFLGTLERRANLGTRVAYVLDSLSRSDAPSRDRAKCQHAIRVAGDRKAVTHPAANLHQPRRLQVRQIERQTWPQIEKAHTGFRFLDQGRGNTKPALPYRNCISNVHLQPRQQAVIHPHRARLRDCLRCLRLRVIAGSNGHSTLQRIPRAHSLDLGKNGTLSGYRHARKTHRVGRRKAQVGCCLAQRIIDRTVRNHHQIRAQELARL